MKIKLYLDDVLKEEFVEDGFAVLVKTKNVSVINLFSEEKAFVSPYYDKEYFLPNGNVCTIRISMAPVFQEAANNMKQFKGLKHVEICNGNAKLQIEY